MALLKGDDCACALFALVAAESASDAPNVVGKSMLKSLFWGACSTSDMMMVQLQWVGASDVDVSLAFPSVGG